MKSYSGKGIYNTREAKGRRKEFDSPKWRGLCRGRYMTKAGYWQLDNDRSSCVMGCLSEGTDSFEWFSGSLEEWLDGYPVDVVTVA